VTEKLAYADQTSVHPVGLALWLVLAFLTWRARRSTALVPLFVLVCFIPMAQRVAIAGLDFTLLRLLLLVGWMRVLARGEHRALRLIALDRVVILHIGAGAIANSILHGTQAIAIYNLGLAFDGLGSYFLVRIVLRSFEDLDATIGGILWISLVLVVPFLYEAHVEPHRNLFSVFGGVAEITGAREGKVRAHGAFPHAIIAGCFWAALLPLILARYWTRPERRPLALVSLASALAMIHACASSTPAAGALAALGAAAFYPLRSFTAAVRWGAALLLVSLHMAMTMPVWHLVARIDLVGGSTGWHRYSLIDNAIRRFPEWWLVGTRSTAEWGRGLFDVTNQYVLEAVRGGALTLGLFIAVIALAFRGVGRILRGTEGDAPRQRLAWMLGASILAHAAMFIAVSYFGQIYALWYFGLAAIASLEERVTRPRPVAMRPIPSAPVPVAAASRIPG